MTNFFKNHKPYLICLAIYFSLGGLVLYVFEKGIMELYLNTKHQAIMDLFFKYWTFIGDGWFVAIVIVTLLLYKYYYGLICLLAILLQTAIVQYLKLVIYHWEPRPKTFFLGQKVYYIEGLDIHGFNSFPSGHTSQAFCMSTILALLVAREFFKNKDIIQVLLFLLAFLVGLSRVYLMQHFVRDTYAGAVFGCLIAYIVFYIFETQFKLRDSVFMSSSLLKRKREEL